MSLAIRGKRPDLLTSDLSLMAVGFGVVALAKRATFCDDGKERIMTRPVSIPYGAWPRRMSAPFAARYCGESSVEAFLKRVGTEYPKPRIVDGRRKLWLRDDLDQAILP